MAGGEELHFLCVPKMAEKMDRIVALGGGEIFSRNDKTFGIVISVRKKEQ